MFFKKKLQREIQHSLFEIEKELSFWASLQEKLAKDHILDSDLNETIVHKITVLTNHREGIMLYFNSKNINPHTEVV